MSTDRSGNDHTSQTLDRSSETRDTVPPIEGAARSANLERADSAAPREDHTGRLHQVKDWATRTSRDAMITATVVIGMSGPVVAGHLDNRQSAAQSDEQTSEFTISAARPETNGEHGEQKSLPDKLLGVVEHSSEPFHEAYESLEARRKADEDVAMNPDGDPIVIQPDF